MTEPTAAEIAAMHSPSVEQARNLQDLLAAYVEAYSASTAAMQRQLDITSPKGKARANAAYREAEAQQRARLTAVRDTIVRLAVEIVGAEHLAERVLASLAEPEEAAQLGLELALGAGEPT